MTKIVAATATAIRQYYLIPNDHNVTEWLILDSSSIFYFSFPIKSLRMSSEVLSELGKKLFPSETAEAQLNGACDTMRANGYPEKFTDQ